METIKKAKMKRTFGNSVYAEMSKLSSLPFIWLILFGTLAMTIIFALVFPINTRENFSGEAADFINLGLTPITYTHAGFYILGVIASCSEYIGGQIRTTLTVIPNRIEQRLAATVGIIPVAFISALVICVISVTITYFMFNNIDMEIDMWLTMRMILNAAIYLTMMTIFSSAMGIIVRRSIPVVGGLMVYLFIVSPLLVGQSFAFYLPDVASTTLWFTNAPEEAPPSIIAWMVLIGWTLVFLIASIVITKRRDM
ncbi:hypothetical protein KFZ56_02145 [Virgibacillus sp. NKC19-3]|uniref:hypothetical protein n=1 Tax=Virgibacillus saliphilus TaxID=2831674 RepID=UPI001C9B39A2|nr:hypothetical protein [Virgibacillus sp. NKC19-3]MBY7141905.1 hypothetical protein [Virgibacillus sp. NKC19-3]